MITAPEKVPTKLRANDKLNRLQIISLISLFVLFTLSPFFQKKQNPLQAAKEFWELFNAGKLSHRTLLIAEEFSNWDLDQQPVQDTITISYEAG
jgi:hypothetical protein